MCYMKDLSLFITIFIAQGAPVEEPVRRRSLTDFTLHVSDGNVSPPPIPPPPTNYSIDKSVKG